MERKGKSASGPVNAPPMLLLSARSWAIYNADTGELMDGKLERERREIASITKTMTAYTAIGIVTRLDINVHASKVETSFEATNMCGTSAELAEGDVLSIWDMLHAMLLPSGNDAAYALAEYFGVLLDEMGISATKSKPSNPMRAFVAEMNKNAKSLGLSNTTFANPHGLQNSMNKSTAYDVAKLSAACMRLPMFAEVVKKQRYVCVGQDMFDKQKRFSWENTNKLLAKGFCGVKTGITPAAGPCLACCFQGSPGVNLVLVVLACKTMEHRWDEIVQMRDWALLQLRGSDFYPRLGKKKALMLMDGEKVRREEELDSPPVKRLC